MGERHMTQFNCEWCEDEGYVVTKDGEYLSCPYCSMGENFRLDGERKPETVHPLPRWFQARKV